MPLSPASVTPPVQQGHGPPGHGASGSRAARSFASYRRPEWDSRGEGFGSKVLEAIEGRCYLLWCFPGLRDKRSHDTQRPSLGSRTAAGSAEWGCLSTIAPIKVPLRTHHMLAFVDEGSCRT
ncbi:uncharacterized protein TrAFT101_008938 [Trichoderma asperellum]|uniref:uncharacterized protein n=1 Tax=Trichoderma asperellum TaxID=101201 RepID=UPI00331CD324|nr:hypothetical protein TrAFT101_008938 [Trichoderma asperellum]